MDISVVFILIFGVILLLYFLTAKKRLRNLPSNGDESPHYSIDNLQKAISRVFPEQDQIVVSKLLKSFSFQISDDGSFIVQPTSEQISLIAKRVFDEEEHEEILTLLNQYGKKKWEQEGKERVQLAILKASNGKKDRLIELVTEGKKDFRDPLIAAETPNFFSSAMEGKFAEFGSKESHEVFDADLRQYVLWLLKQYS